MKDLKELLSKECPKCQKVIKPIHIDFRLCKDEGISYSAIFVFYFCKCYNEELGWYDIYPLKK